MLRKIWSNHPPLAATSLLMFAAFLFSVAGILLDPRMITGAPAWLKPAKFGISTALYTATLAWLFGYITVWPRFKRAMGLVIAAVVIVEVAIIDTQAARGTTSHFNVSTPLNAGLFAVMSGAILMLLLANIGILVALFRQKFTDPAWGWALRLGLLITILGASLGGLMTRPTHAQVESLQRHEHVAAVGAHTVGAPDGGQGIPVLHWSSKHGDLRIPHFFGLHGIQIIPLFAWLIRRSAKGADARRQTKKELTDTSGGALDIAPVLRVFFKRRAVTGIFAFAGGYAGVVALLTWQALAGRPLLG
ncbi:MAG TPA: hypothetical protein VH369_04115 [Bryobacteraceae bacterium]